MVLTCLIRQLSYEIYRTNPDTLESVVRAQITLKL